MVGMLLALAVFLLIIFGTFKKGNVQRWSGILTLSLLLIVAAGCSAEPAEQSGSNTDASEEAVQEEPQENERVSDSETTSDAVESEEAETDSNQTDNQTEASQGTLQVHFVDVGQGAAQVIITPNNKVMVIDGGNNDDEDDMVAYLNELGVKKVDILIGTHPDADHIGGIDAVIDSFDIGQIYMPKIQSNTQTFESVLQSIANKGLKVTTAQAGITLNLDPAVEAVMIAPLKQSDDSNEMSAVVRLSYGEQSFLFTGDAGVETEQELMASGATLQSNVLLVGHHGSKHSTSAAFVKAVQPTYGVIQVGKNNYGHPEESVLSTLSAAGVQIYRTDTDGTIIFMTDGKTMEVNKNAWEYNGSQSGSSAGADTGQNNSTAVTTPITATASIDDSAPTQNSTVTVTVQVKDSNGAAVSSANVSLNLHYKSTDTLYEGTTNSNGIAVLTFKIGRAAKGYTVNGDITVTAGEQTTSASTAFTPQ